jgi:hypothetical protein
VLKIRILCPNEATYLPVNCGFNELSILHRDSFSSFNNSSFIGGGGGGTNGRPYK